MVSRLTCENCQTCTLRRDCGEVVSASELVFVCCMSHSQGTGALAGPHSDLQPTHHTATHKAFHAAHNAVEEYDTRQPLVVLSRLASHQHHGEATGREVDRSVEDQSPVERELPDVWRAK